VSTHDHFQLQVDQLQSAIIQTGELSAKAIGEAVAAFVAKDVTLAREVIHGDYVIDRDEDEHEEQIVQIIALNQPVARDLRLLVACLRVNTAIERAGDLAVNIAQSAIRIAGEPSIKPYVDIPRSYEIVRAMWNDALRAFYNLDESLAREIFNRDDTVDRLNQEVITQLIGIASSSPEFIFQVTNVIGVSKGLERIADLAVDISNEVIFVCRGEICRHMRNTA
jgi:phosphate transport system protein